MDREVINVEVGNLKEQDIYKVVQLMRQAQMHGAAFIAIAFLGTTAMKFSNIVNDEIERELLVNLINMEPDR